VIKIRKDYHIISDTHFGHETMITNGYRETGFEYIILENISKLPADDFLIHLGDVAFYNQKMWNELFLEKCKCEKKILVRGNHDKKSLSWYYDRGWDFVCESFSLVIYGVHVLFSHIPIEYDNMLITKEDLNIHGHLHDGSYRSLTTDKYHELINIEKTMNSVVLSKILNEWAQTNQKDIISNEDK
jgi:calcineurin-like phosphoesterase family protein